MSLRDRIERLERGINATRLLEITIQGGFSGADPERTAYWLPNKGNDYLRAAPDESTEDFIARARGVANRPSARFLIFGGLRSNRSRDLEELTDAELETIARGGIEGPPLSDDELRATLAGRESEPHSIVGRPGDCRRVSGTEKREVGRTETFRAPGRFEKDG